MPVVINGTTGIDTIQDNTVTTAKIVNGTIVQADLATNVAGTGPAFSAYASAATTLTQNSFVKVLFATEAFDTNSNFASSRFTPTVAGYYHITGTIAADVTGVPAVLLASIFLNNSRFKDGSFSAINNAQGGWSTTSSVIYLNGSTDYVELYAYIGGITSITTQASQNATHFSGALIRSA
jgi:hypothetical protein